VRSRVRNDRGGADEPGTREQDTRVPRAREPGPRDPGARDPGTLEPRAREPASPDVPRAATERGTQRGGRRRAPARGGAGKPSMFAALISRLAGPFGRRETEAPEPAETREPVRRRRGEAAGAVALHDVLGAALAGIEQVHRVSVDAQPAVGVHGRAVSDVVRLIGELVRNTTSLSAGNSQVMVAGHLLDDGGLLIEITDGGADVGAEALAQANWQLANPRSADAAGSGQPGLLVVGRLAAIHRIQVQLRRSTRGGLTTLAWLPDDLVVKEATHASADDQRLRPTGQAGELARHTHRAGRAGQRAAAESVAQAVAAARMPRFAASPHQQATSGPASRPGPAAGPPGPGAGGGRRSARPAAGPERAGPATGPQRVGGPGLGPRGSGPEPGPRGSGPEPGPRGVGAEPGPRGSGPEPGPRGVGAEPGPPGVGAEPAPPRRFREEPAGSRAQPMLGAPVRPQVAGMGGLGPGRGRLTGPQPASPKEEARLPIFEAVRADWFRRGRPATGAHPGSERAGRHAGAAVGLRWTSPADDDWRAAEAAHDPVTGAATHAGLPKRIPRANLIPGTAAAHIPPPQLPPRSAEALRGRLASFQRGGREGRAAAGEPRRAPPHDQPPSAGWPPTGGGPEGADGGSGQ
jgi:hypothetical protein